MLFLLLACGQTHTPGCESTTREIADDEPLPDLELSVADLFAGLAGERIVPAQVLGDDREVLEVAAVSVTAARGEGGAEWTNAEAVDNVRPYFGIGDEYLLIGVVCDGGLTVPTTLDVAREDGGGALAADATLKASPTELARGSVSLSSATVSADGDWATFKSAYAGFEAGRLTSLQLQDSHDIRLDWP
ncbi:hypothetical protein LBMAG42_42990 [Deltaproteobacteria bacterium]|nr:hypothetical protein LBMAG42_42990 [Deltaproteobacteria bacterium]